MNLIVLIIVGLIAGWIGSVVMTGHGFGAAGNILIGIVGAFVGGILFDIFDLRAYGFWGAVGLATVGAIVFLFIASLFPRVPGPTGPVGRI